MLSTSAHPTSADGLRWYPVYGLQDASDISCFIDAQPYDVQPPFAHPDGIDPQLLLLDDPLFNFDFGFDATTNLSYPSESEILFGDSHSFGWPQEPYLGQYTIPELMQESASVGAVGGEIPSASPAGRSCSPASDTGMLSDGSSLSSLSSSDFSTGAQSPGPSNPSSSAGPSGSQHGQLMLGLGLSAVGPVRRGRGRPRKDAPPVHQPPPLCAYVDPLTGAACGKLLNRHHDLPRHMVKHRQEEAALVNTGRLPRECATLLPPDWKHTDELKLPCRFCSATFSRADAVTRHEKREHKHRPRRG